MANLIITETDKFIKYTSDDEKYVVTNGVLTGSEIIVPKTLDIPNESFTLISVDALMSDDDCLTKDLILRYSKYVKELVEARGGESSLSERLDKLKIDGGQEVFVVHTESGIKGDLSVLETYGDILNAHNSGKIIRFIMEDDFVVYPLVQFDRSDNSLYFQYEIDNTWYVYKLQSEGCSMQQIAYIKAMDSERYDAEIGDVSKLPTSPSVVGELLEYYAQIEAHDAYISEMDAKKLRCFVAYELPDEGDKLTYTLYDNSDMRPGDVLLNFFEGIAAPYLCVSTEVSEDGISSVGTFERLALGVETTMLIGEAEALRGDVETLTDEKADKVIIDDWNLENFTSDTLDMEHNIEKRYGELTALTIQEIPMGLFGDVLPEDFISSVVFTSGATPTNLVYASEWKMSGEDCIDGVFTPVANKRYTIIVSYDGEYLTGIVGGVSI